MTSRQIEDAAEGNTRSIPTTQEELAAFDKRKRIAACERVVLEAAKKRADASAALDAMPDPKSNALLWCERMQALDDAAEEENRAVAAWREARGENQRREP